MNKSQIPILISKDSFPAEHTRNNCTQRHAKANPSNQSKQTLRAFKNNQKNKLYLHTQNHACLFSLVTINVLLCYFENLLDKILNERKSFVKNLPTIFLLFFFYLFFPMGHSQQCSGDMRPIQIRSYGTKDGTWGFTHAKYPRYYRNYYSHTQQYFLLIYIACLNLFGLGI